MKIEELDALKQMPVWFVDSNGNRKANGVLPADAPSLFILAELNAKQLITVAPDKSRWMLTRRGNAILNATVS